MNPPQHETVTQLAAQIFQRAHQEADAVGELGEARGILHAVQSLADEFAAADPGFDGGQFKGRHGGSLMTTETTSNGKNRRMATLPNSVHPLIDNAVCHASCARLVVVPTHTDILLRVEDDGEGIAPPTSRRIFDAGHSAAGNGGAPASGCRSPTDWPARAPARSMHSRARERG
jgi:hypothetical protein